MRHFKCYEEVHVEKPLAKRMSETITFLPQNISMPNTNCKKASVEIIEDLVKLLKSNSLPPPFEQHKDPTLSSIDKLAEAFETKR